MATLPLYLTLPPELFPSDATMVALHQMHVTAPPVFLHLGGLHRKSGGATVKGCVVSKQAAVGVTK